jgi:molybdopterin molybdotransferase
MSEANCFIVLDEAVGNVAPGALVQVQVLEGIV